MMRYLRFLFLSSLVVIVVSKSKVIQKSKKDPLSDEVQDDNVKKGTEKRPATHESISTHQPFQSTKANKKGDLAEDNEIFLDYAEHSKSKALDAKHDSQMISKQAKAASFHRHDTMGYSKSSIKEATDASIGDQAEDNPNEPSKATTNSEVTVNEFNSPRNTLKAEAVKAMKELKEHRNITIPRKKFISTSPNINNNNTKNDSKYVTASADLAEEENASLAEESHNSRVTSLSSSSIGAQEINEVEQDLLDAESTKSDTTGTTKLPASEIIPVAKASNETKSGARSFDDPFGNPGFKAHEEFMERNRNDIVNKMHGFGRSIKTGDLNDNQTNTTDSENLEEEADVSGKNETNGSSTTHANVSDYENVEGDYAPSGVNETDDSIMATKSRTEVVTSGTTTKSASSDLDSNSTPDLPTVGDLSFNKSKIKEHFERQNKTVQKVLGRSLILSPPNFDSHKNRHLVNSRKCGRSAMFQTKIVGGSSTSIDEFPWLAQLGTIRKDSHGEMKFLHPMEYHCGGSLISDKWILTAGHCVVFEKTDDIVDGVRAKFGATSRKQTLGIVEIDSQKLILHEKYKDDSAGSPDFDVALIKLKRRMSDFGDEIEHVNTICLPFNYFDGRSWAGKDLVVAGWGVMHQETIGSGFWSQVIDHKVAEGLQKLKVNHVSTEKCKAAWDVRGNSERIVPAAHSRHLCAGGIEGEDSCGGDSGGPLMLEQKNRGGKNFTLVGLVSWGSNVCAVKNLPGIYADVPYFLEWILNNID